MRASMPRTLGSWTRQPLGTLWKMGELAGDYLAPPQMTLVPASTHFGRLEHAHGPLALLLVVSFRNESARHIWLHSLAIYDAGTWYQPMPFLGDRVHLLSPQHQHDLSLPRTHSSPPRLPTSRPRPSPNALRSSACRNAGTAGPLTCGSPPRPPLCGGGPDAWSSP